MRDNFRGKTWIYWVQFIVFSAIGIPSLVIGIIFWTGPAADAWRGPPMTICTAVVSLLGILGLMNILARGQPIIRCYREGIECRVIGEPSVGWLHLLPELQIVLSVVMLPLFRVRRVRVEWGAFRSASVGGIPMARILTLDGTGADVRSGQAFHGLQYPQVDFRQHPDEIAQTLNHFAADVSLRTRLKSWPPIVGRV